MNQVSEKSELLALLEKSDHGGKETCDVCGEEGDLMICDGCLSGYHQSCAGVIKVPEGNWFCERCSTVLVKSETVHDAETCGQASAVKTGKKRPKPAGADTATKQRGDRENTKPKKKQSLDRENKQPTDRGDKSTKEKQSSDTELLSRIKAELPNVIKSHEGNPEELTGRVVRTKLEEILGVELSEYKKSILKLTKQVFDQLNAE